MTDKNTREDILQLAIGGVDAATIACSMGLSIFEVEKIIDNTSIKMPDKQTREEIFRLTAAEHDTATIANRLGLPVYKVEGVLDKDRSKARHNKKWEDCLRRYRNGETLEAIGEKYGLTRERVRQICRKQLAVELGYGPGLEKYYKEQLDTIYRSIVNYSSEDRVKDAVEKKLEKAKKRGLDPEYFETPGKYSRATGITVEYIKKYLPDTYKTLKRNQNIAKSRWNTYYDACRMCGKTDYKHRGYGYCDKCYTLSPEFKAIVQRSNLKNREARLAHNRKYAEDYYNRPEVIERLEREYDEKYFGGNRKLALERDGYKCISCGMTTDVKYKSGKPKVRVWHLDDPNDNRLENLGTYDQSCFIKKYGHNGKFRLRRH